jgi:hypothetical protein
MESQQKPANERTERNAEDHLEQGSPEKQMFRTFNVVLEEKVISPSLSL